MVLILLGSRLGSISDRVLLEQMVCSKGVTEESLTKGWLTDVWAGPRGLRRDGANPGTSNSGKPLAHLDPEDKGREWYCWSPWRAVATEEHERLRVERNGQRVTGTGQGVSKLSPLFSYPLNSASTSPAWLCDDTVLRGQPPVYSAGHRGVGNRWGQVWRMASAGELVEMVGDLS